MSTRFGEPLRGSGRRDVAPPSPPPAGRRSADHPAQGKRGTSAPWVIHSNSDQPWRGCIMVPARCLNPYRVRSFSIPIPRVTLWVTLGWMIGRPSACQAAANFPSFPKWGFGKRNLRAKPHFGGVGECPRHRSERCECRGVV